MLEATVQKLFFKEDGQVRVEILHTIHKYGSLNSELGVNNANDINEGRVAACPQG